MTGATQKFFDFLNDKLDKFAKPLTTEQAFQLQMAQNQIVNADRADYIAAKKTQTIFTASLEGWVYNKVGADISEFIADIVEFMLAIGLAYCVRCAEQRIKTIWKQLPIAWQTQPIYDTLYRYKERDDENLKSNLEVALKNARTNPSAFLDSCLKNDSGAILRKKEETARRVLLEEQLKQKEQEEFQNHVQSEFAELAAEEGYQDRYAECIKWYHKKYPKSFIDIEKHPSAINGYLLNLKYRGDYEQFNNGNVKDSGQTENTNDSILEDE